MAKLEIRKFSGLATENAVTFLNEFKSYATLHKIDENEDQSRKIAAFHLHLAGPALTWYSSLDDEQTDTWEHLEAAFKARYTLDNAPSLLVESEVFNSMVLLPGQPIEEFQSCPG